MFLAAKELENKRIRSKQLEIEPEEIFWDAITRKKGDDVFKKKIEVPLTQKTLKGLWLVFLFSLIFILVRVFQFQILNHQELAVLAQKNKFAITSLEAQRGVIYDRNFEQLVFNRHSFNLIAKKSDFPADENEKRQLFEKIAWILKTNPREIEAKIETETENEVLIAQDLDYQKLILFESNSQELEGFVVQDDSVRDYKDEKIFSHIIGYFRKSGQNAGVEDFYDEALSPKLGQIIAERDVYGNIISEKLVSLPESGNGLVLWLDAGLQEKLYQTMFSHMQEIGAKKGAAVAMNPKTGGILAMVSFPGFDNNLFAQGISQQEWEKLISDVNTPFLNRVITGRYATGSTIKPLVASAALQEGIISEQKTINCEGQIVIDNPWFLDQPFVYRDWAIHGLTDVKKAIAQSCNVFFYTIGGGYKNFEGLGPENLKKYLEFFGWGQILGIDLPGEEKGFIPDKAWKQSKFSSPDNIWMPGDTYNLSIGQGFISVTPLEVAAAISAIANDGKLLKPQVVQRIIDQDKNTTEEFQANVIRENFIDKKNLKIVREGMRGTVTYGTALALNNLPVAAAAKTGTAQTSKKDYYHNWLTVFAPYDDPEIVLTLMVEQVPETYSVVLPTAKEVLEWYFGGEKPQENIDEIVP